MRNIAQLDALRGVAILFVLINHTLPQSHLLFKLSDKVSGPDIFFTISGFLITALLLKDRKALASQRIFKPRLFINFLVKRAFRLYPAYYLLVAVDFLLRGTAASRYDEFLSFTSNLVIYQQQEWGPLAHLWTMAVEQQFYLLWPIVIVLLPRPWLPYVIAVFIGGGVYCQRTLPATGFSHVLPQTCFDALGLGALLAWVISEKPQYILQVYRYLCVLAVTSGALMLGNIAFKLNSPLTQRTLVALLVVWLIAYFVVRGEKKGVVLNALFTNKILIFIGKMSYGIYLYHLTVLYCSYPVLNWLNSYLPFYERHAYGYWLVETQLIIVALAWGSWKYVESPLHALGKRLVEKKPIPSSAAPASS